MEALSQYVRSGASSCLWTLGRRAAASIGECGYQRGGLRFLRYGSLRGTVLGLEVASWGHLPPGAWPPLPGTWPDPACSLVGPRGLAFQWSACRSLVRPPGSEVRCTLVPIHAAPRVLQAQALVPPSSGPQVGSEATFRVQPGFPWASPGPVWGPRKHPPLSGFPRSDDAPPAPTKGCCGAVPLSSVPGWWHSAPPAPRGLMPPQLQGFSKACPSVFAHGGRGAAPVW